MVNSNKIGTEGVGPVNNCNCLWGVVRLGQISCAVLDVYVCVCEATREN